MFGKLYRPKIKLTNLELDNILTPASLGTGSQVYNHDYDAQQYSEQSCKPVEFYHVQLTNYEQLLSNIQM